MSDDTLYVTQPSLPPLEEFIPYLEEIWANRRLTNNGPMHVELEARLCEYLGVEEVALFANGTLALLTALRALDLCGEVITTPFSFIATAHALRWSGLTPVFVDTEADGFNIDPQAVERAITDKTVAILPVHCYGDPCDTAAIEAIGRRHDLKVIYDAAHAFGVEDSHGSVLRHGDLSVLSFHATKVFTTFEGGAIVCHDPQMKQRLVNLKNFGIVNETTVIDTGINGKLNEVSSAFGLLQLRHIDELLKRRSRIAAAYRERLGDLPGLQVPPDPHVSRANHSYFPVLVTPSFRLSRDGLYEHMKLRGVHPRKYFYPLITQHAMYREAAGAKAPLTNAHRLAREVLCLPIYPDMSGEDVDRVVDALRSAR